ncbi:MAG: hypothetical protein AB1778_05705 [Candidatus Bipolaricaulota bacterium]
MSHSLEADLRRAFHAYYGKDQLEHAVTIDAANGGRFTWALDR